MTGATLPSLPDNQRWQVSGFLRFVTVALQERRWWGWRTIAKSVCDQDEGGWGVVRTAQMILKRDYYDEWAARAEAERASRRAEIPYGTHQP